MTPTNFATNRKPLECAATTASLMPKSNRLHKQVFGQNRRFKREPWLKSWPRGEHVRDYLNSKTLCLTFSYVLPTFSCVFDSCNVPYVSANYDCDYDYKFASAFSCAMRATIFRRWRRARSSTWKARWQNMLYGEPIFHIVCKIRLLTILGGKFSYAFVISSKLWKMSIVYWIVEYIFAHSDAIYSLCLLQTFCSTQDLFMFYMSCCISLSRVCVIQLQFKFKVNPLLGFFLFR